jgi:hypothetical protein
MFTWNTIANVVGYEYQISTDNTFADPTKFIANTVNSPIVLPPTPIIPFPTACSIYYWRVRGVKGTIKGDWSQTWSISYKPKPTQVILLSPIDNEPLPVANLRPTLRWNSAANAQGYSIRITKNGNTIVKDTFTVNTFYTFSFDLENDVQYTWKVVANGCTGGNNGDTSLARSFNIPTIAPPCNYTITLLSPPDGSTQNNPIKLEWNSIPSGAIGYDVEVSDDATFSSVISRDRVSIAQIFKIVAQGKTLYWRVRAVCSQSDTAWSKVFSFETTNNSASCLQGINKDFGDIRINTSQRGSVYFTNTSSEVVVIDSASITPPTIFSVLDFKYFPIIIQPNATLALVLVEAFPTTTGIQKATVTISGEKFQSKTKCISTAELTVNGVVQDTASADILIYRTDNTSLPITSGELVNIEVAFADNPTSIDPKNFDSLIIRFTYDRRAFQ